MKLFMFHFAQRGSQTPCWESCDLALGVILPPRDITRTLSKWFFWGGRTSKRDCLVRNSKFGLIRDLSEALAVSAWQRAEQKRWRDLKSYISSSFFPPLLHVCPQLTRILPKTTSVAPAACGYSRRHFSSAASLWVEFAAVASHLKGDREGVNVQYSINCFACIVGYNVAWSHTSFWRGRMVTHNWQRNSRSEWMWEWHQVKLTIYI